MIEKIVATRDLAEHSLDVALLFRSGFKTKFLSHDDCRYVGIPFSYRSGQKQRTIMREPFFDEAIQAAELCAKESSQSLIACLQNPEVERLRETILLNMDCIDVCRAVASLLSRTSEQSRELLSFSYRLFEQAADECGKHKDIPQAVQCSRTCEHMSSLCRRLEKDFVPGFTH